MSAKTLTFNDAFGAEGRPWAGTTRVGGNWYDEKQRRIAVVGSRLGQAMAERYSVHESLVRALVHMRYRNHDVSVGCDACVAAHDVLLGIGR